MHIFISPQNGHVHTPFPTHCNASCTNYSCGGSRLYWEQSLESVFDFCKGHFHIHTHASGDNLNEDSAAAPGAGSRRRHHGIMGKFKQGGGDRVKYLTLPNQTHTQGPVIRLIEEGIQCIHYLHSVASEARTAVSSARST